MWWPWVVALIALVGVAFVLIGLALGKRATGDVSDLNQAQRTRDGSGWRDTERWP